MKMRIANFGHLIHLWIILIPAVLKYSKAGSVSKDPITPRLLGTTPTGKRTMHFGFGAPGAEKAKLGVRVQMKGFKDFDMVFTKDECYSTEAEALKNVKHIVDRFNPGWTFKYDKNR